MNKFLKYILLLVLFAYILPAILAFSLPSNPNGYYKGYELKYNRLDTMKSPRLLVFGGSEVAMSINSRLLQDSLKMNVANLGLHAGLGIDLNLNDALKYSRKGDVVLFSFSSFLGSGQGGSDAFSVPYLVDYFPSKFFELSYPNKACAVCGIFPLLKGKINYLKSKWSGKDTQFYTLKSIDEYGDIIKPQREPYVYPGKGKVDSTDYVTQNTSYLTSVADRLNALKKRGCIVYIIPSVRHQLRYQSDRLAIGRLAEFMKERGIEQLFDAKESAVPNELLYDNPYHTNNEGAVFYSNLIVKHLNPVLSAQQ